MNTDPPDITFGSFCFERDSYQPVTLVCWEAPDEKLIINELEPNL